MKKATAAKKTSKSKPKSSSTKPQIAPKTQSKSIPKKSTKNTSQSKDKVKEEPKKQEVKSSQFKPEEKQKEKEEPKKEKVPNTKSVKFPDEKRDEYKVIRTIKAHDDWVQKLLILKNGKVVTCSQDSTLKLWDLVTDDIKTKKTPIFIYKGHTDAVTDVIQYTNEKLVSISRDKTIKQWNINSGKEITSYNANMPFSCIIQISDTQVALGSGDKTIKFYDLSPMDNNFGDEKIDLEFAVLEGHQEEVICLENYDGVHLFSGGNDYKIKVWDITKKEFLFDLEGHVQGVQCLKLIENGKKLLSGGYDNVVRVWDWENKKQEFVLEGHTGHIMCIGFIGNDRIVSGATDWSLIVWDLIANFKEELFCFIDNNLLKIFSCGFSFLNKKVVDLFVFNLFPFFKLYKPEILFFIFPFENL